MAGQTRRVRIAKRRDIIWVILIMLFVWMSLAVVGVDFNIAFLLGMSSVVVFVVGLAYSDAKTEPRYWIVLGIYSLAHIFSLAVLGGNWIPHPAAALTPLFLLDFIILGFLFPKLSRIEFESD